MLCKNCGTEFEGNFCPNCGAKATLHDSENEYASKENEAHVYYDKDGDVIDLSVIYGAYMTRSEIEKFILKYTNYEPEKAHEIAKYTVLHVTKKEYSFMEAVRMRVQIEGAFSSANKIQKAVKPAPRVSSQTFESRSYSETPIVLPKSIVEKPPRVRKLSKKELKIQAHNSGQACCPRCGFVSLSANKKGFGIVKGGLGALAGGFLTGGVGAVVGAGAGNINAKKVWVTCLNCGKRWKM